MNGITPLSRTEVFRYLRDKEYASVELHFSGGNDEGGVDIVKIKKTDGTPVEDDDHNLADSIWIDAEGMTGWGADRRPATEEEKTHARIAQGLSKPIFDQYYTFAGDFYVNGVVTWDLEKGTVIMARDEEVRDWEHREFEV